MLKAIGIKLDASDLAKLRQIAEQEQRSIGFLIRQSVKLYLNPTNPREFHRQRKEHSKKEK
jgi:hypothetical protein